MKNIFLTAFLFSLLSNMFARAEFVLISSPKGYAVVKVFSGIQPIDTIWNGAAVFIDKRSEAGLHFEYSYNDRYTSTNLRKSGYLKPEDVISIDSGAVLIPTIGFGNNLLFKEGSGIKVVVEQSAFDEKENIITHKSGGDVFYMLINDREFYGCFGVPLTQYKSIDIHISKTRITIKKEFFNDLYNPHLEKSLCYYRSDTNTIYLISASEYHRNIQLGLVIWVIQDGEVKQRMIKGKYMGN